MIFEIIRDSADSSYILPWKRKDTERKLKRPKKETDTMRNKTKSEEKNKTLESQVNDFHVLIL